MKKGMTFTFESPPSLVYVSNCQRLIANPAGHNGNLAERKCKSGRTLMQICEDRNSPAPRNSFTDRSMAYYPRRCDHFPYTSPSGSHSGHLQGTSGAQVNCTKVRRVRYSLPADKKHLTQRAASCENGWSVRESGLGRRRGRSWACGWSQWNQIGSSSPTWWPPTAAERLLLVPMNFKSDRTASYSTSITTIPSPELIGHRKRLLRDTLADLQVDADLQSTAS